MMTKHEINLKKYIKKKKKKFGPQKFKFILKWLNLQGKLELNLRSFFAYLIFFVWFLVFEIQSLLVIFVLKKTLVFFSEKKMSMKIKDSHCSDWSFCRHEFFLVRFLIYEFLSILYFTLLNSDLGLGRLTGKQRSLALQNMPLTLTCLD